MPNRLRARFLSTAQTYLQRNKAQILRCADAGASFEGWLNWELALAFQNTHPWPRFSMFREYRAPDGGLADIALFYEEADWDTPLRRGVRVESKLVWNNSNRGKQLRAVGADRDDIRHSKGIGVLVVTAVTAGKEGGSVRVGDAEHLHAALPKAVTDLERVTLADFAAPISKAWWMSPRVSISAYLVD